MASEKIQRKIITMGHERVLAIQVYVDGKPYCTLMSNIIAKTKGDVAAFAGRVLGATVNLKASEWGEPLGPIDGMPKEPLVGK